MTSPVFDLSGAVLTLVGPVAVLMPSYITFAWPQSAASWILAHRFCQYSLAEEGVVPSDETPGAPSYANQSELRTGKLRRHVLFRSLATPLECPPVCIKA